MTCVKLAIKSYLYIQNIKKFILDSCSTTAIIYFTLELAKIGKFQTDNNGKIKIKTKSTRNNVTTHTNSQSNLVIINTLTLWGFRHETSGIYVKVWRKHQRDIVRPKQESVDILQ